MLNVFFNWLREGAKNAILDGVADAVETATGTDKPVPPRLAALAAKLTPTPALPPAEAETDTGTADDKPVKKRGQR